MTARAPRNVAASVHRRLLNLVAERHADANETLLRYVRERFLYRLSQSAHANAFMLKGATLFAVWEDEPHRPTRDIDLLGLGEDSAEHLRKAFIEVCSISVPDDGVVFEPHSVTVADIREGQAFGGKRVLIDSRLGNARLRVQVDVGFGDALARAAQPVLLPVLLDFPAPCLLAYPVEAVIAEKLHAMAEHGMVTGRLKDIYDVFALAARLEFEGAELVAAIRTTFESRGRHAGEVPPPITPAFAADSGANARWVAFTRRNRLAPLGLSDAIDQARAFLLEPLAALAADAAFTKRWPPGGPWQ